MFGQVPMGLFCAGFSKASFDGVCGSDPFALVWGFVSKHVSRSEVVAHATAFG